MRERENSEEKQFFGWAELRVTDYGLLTDYGDGQTDVEFEIVF